MEWAIDVQGLTKRFGKKTVVRDLSLRVRRGEICGFLGPNGSGKTTTIRMLCGLLKSDGGSGACLGHDIVKESDRIKKQVGYMTQHFSYYQDLTVRENLDFVARIYGIEDRKSKMERTMERLGLGARKNQLAGTLSGGWKQRLALAASLLPDPKLLMLDEPTAGVDPRARREFWDEIHRLTAEEGLTALVSTHFMDEAERCHRLIYIAYGYLLAHGTTEEVVRESGLTTWTVSGGDLTDLERRLKGLPAVTQVAHFGNALHVSGKDPDRLGESLSPFMTGGYRWTRIPPSLEDVFINLMAETKGNAS
jgi:ABC-2 type transport system ATP-binding protein